MNSDAEKGRFALCQNHLVYINCVKNFTSIKFWKTAEIYFIVFSKHKMNIDTEL